MDSVDICSEEEEGRRAYDQDSVDRASLSMQRALYARIDAFVLVARVVHSQA